MSKQAALSLIEESRNDRDLFAQLETAEGSAKVIEIGKARGYEFTEEELISAMHDEQLSFAGEQPELDKSAINFVKEFSENESWKQELEAINTPGDLVRYAESKGYEFTEANIVAVIEECQKVNSQEDELSEEALESVAGGVEPITMAIGAAATAAGTVIGKAIGTQLSRKPKFKIKKW